MQSSERARARGGAAGRRAAKVGHRPLSWRACLAANEELLRALGISHILVVAADATSVTTTITGGARDRRARLGVVDDASASVLDGEEDALLAECCAFVTEGCGSGGALAAGPLYDATERLPAAVVAACAAALAAARRRRAAAAQPLRRRRPPRRCTRRSSSAASSSRLPRRRPPPPPPPASSTVKAAKVSVVAEVRGSSSDSDDSGRRRAERGAGALRPLAAATPRGRARGGGGGGGAAGRCRRRRDGRRPCAAHGRAHARACRAGRGGDALRRLPLPKVPRRLFSSDVLEAHEPGGGEQAFSRRQRSGGNGGGGGGAGACTSLFLQSDAAEALSMVEGSSRAPSARRGWARSTGAARSARAARG